jgi:hypothetical protein
VTTTVAPATLTLESRWARLVGGVWFAAAGMWALGDLVLLAGDGRLPWDVVVVPVLVAVGLACRRSTLSLDEDGFELSDGLRSHRVLWAAVERVEIDWSRRVDAGVHVHLRRGERPLALQATWDLKPREREALLALLQAAARGHGITLEAR